MAHLSPDLNGRTTAHVLYMDVIGSELLKAEHQRAVYVELTDLVRGTAEFRRTAAHGQVIVRPSGDGMALVFFTSLDAALCCALELASQLQSRPHLQLRMGLHTGEVYRLQDINGIEDVTGEGIITAKRVMDCGDAGHLLLSSAAAEGAAKMPAWAEMLHYVGVCEVKHARRLALWSLYTEEIGNPRPPHLILDQLADQTLAAHRTHSSIGLPIREIAIVLLPVITGLVIAGWVSPLLLALIPLGLVVYILESLWRKR